MRERLHRLVIPAYVLLCILLGGSVQGVWRVMALQLLAIALIAWAALTPKREPLTGASKSLLLLAILTILLFILQLVPLPPNVWIRLSGREVIENGYANLGNSLPWLPVSLAPYDTLATSLTLLPPLAVLLGIMRLRAHDESWLAGALLAGTLLAVLLGAIQSLGGMRPDAWWYLYEFTNDGAVGFFANRNHMGTLLLLAIPFAGALFASGTVKTRERGRSEAMLVMGSGGFLLLLVGLALNGSLAALVLAIPTIAFSALILPGAGRGRRIALLAAAVTTIAAVLAFTSSPIRSELAGTDTTSFDTRLVIWERSSAAIAASFPLGTGLGSFEQVYRLYEDPGTVERTFVNHAHNDYLELVLETGAAGLLAISAFLLWWVSQTVSVWRSRLSSHFVKAATIASGVVLAHSIVEYPLRTAAIAAVFASCVAMMAQRQTQVRVGSASEMRSAKHLVIS